ncbi:MAG: CPBP family intramembrane glutamic endopeptidase [Pseudomonadota bacterium]
MSDVDLPPKRRRLISVATLVGFVGITALGSHLFQLVATQSEGYGRLLEIFAYIYLPQLVVAVLLAWLIGGHRRIVGVLGLESGFIAAVLMALIVTLPMLLTLAMTGPFAPPADFVLQTLRSSVFPGFFEELTFRAVLFGFLFRFAGWGFLPAALIGGAVFGAAHLYQEEDAMRALGVFAITGVGGIWFAWLYSEWRFNLWVPIAFHTLMNFWWMLFPVADSALGPMPANVSRLAVIILSVIVTVVVAKRRGGLVVRGRHWLVGGPAVRPPASTS